MTAFEEFADRVLEPIIHRDGHEDDIEGLEVMWVNAAKYLSYQAGYTLRPDDLRYPQDRIAIEDAVMDVFGYNPDWRDEA